MEEDDERVSIDVGIDSEVEIDVKLIKEEDPAEKKNKIKVVVVKAKEEKIQVHETIVEAYSAIEFIKPQ